MRAGWSGVSAAARDAAAEHACARLAPLLPAGPVLLYSALPDELSVEEVARARAGSGALLLPRVEVGGLVACRVGDLDRDLVLGAHGILEPAARCEVVPASAVAAVVLPGRAFDPRGGRLGRGGGHYDRLLQGLSAGVLRVGVAMSWQVVEAVPVQPHDRPVDWIVTEQGAWATGGGR